MPEWPNGTDSSLIKSKLVCSSFGMNEISVGLVPTRVRIPLPAFIFLMNKKYFSPFHKIFKDNAF